MYKFLKTFFKGILSIFYKIEVVDKYKMPTNGPVILCANHMSNWDPVVLAITTDRQIYFMGKEELFKNKFLKYILEKVGSFPVNREKADLKSIRTSLSILKRGDVLGIFPEGTRVKSVYSDNVKEGVGMISNMSNSIIQPVSIVTEYKLFKPIKVIFRDTINPLDFKEFGREANKEITKAVYNKIYDFKE